MGAQPTKGGVPSPSTRLLHKLQSPTPPIGDADFYRSFLLSFEQPRGEDVHVVKSFSSHMYQSISDDHAWSTDRAHILCCLLLHCLVVIRRGFRRGKVGRLEGKALFLVRTYTQMVVENSPSHVVIHRYSVPLFKGNYGAFETHPEHCALIDRLAAVEEPMRQHSASSSSVDERAGLNLAGEVASVVMCALSCLHSTAQPLLVAQEAVHAAVVLFSCPSLAHRCICSRGASSEDTHTPAAHVLTALLTTLARGLPAHGCGASDGDGGVPQPEGLVHSISSAAASIATLPWSMFDGSKDSADAMDSSKDYIASSCALTILAALSHAPQTSDNAFVEAMKSLTDEVPSDQPPLLIAASDHSEDSARGIDSGGIDGGDDCGSSSVAHAPFSPVLSWMMRVMERHPEGLLLMHAMVLRSPSFRAFALSRTDYDALLVPLLHMVHQDCSSSDGDGPGKRVFLVLELLVALSGEPAFHRGLQQVVDEVRWVKECLLVRVSVQSLAVVVLARAVQLHASIASASSSRRGARRRSTPLPLFFHHACLAILGNMSPAYAHLHPHACVRVVKLLKHLLRIHIRSQAAAATHTHSTTRAAEKDAHEPSSMTCTPHLHGDGRPHRGEELHVEARETHRSSSSSSSSSIADGEAHTYTLIHMVLEVITSALSLNMRHVPHLCYAMLQDREVFVKLRDALPVHTGAHGLAQGMVELLEQFEHRVSLIPPHHEVTVDSIYSVIEAVCSTSVSKEYPLAFQLRPQEDAPNAFFLEYTWKVICTRTMDHLRLYEDFLS